MKQMYKIPEMREVAVELNGIVMESFDAGMEPVGNTNYMEDPYEKPEQTW